MDVFALKVTQYISRTNLQKYFRFIHLSLHVLSLCALKSVLHSNLFVFVLIIIAHYLQCRILTQNFPKKIITKTTRTSKKTNCVQYINSTTTTTTTNNNSNLSSPWKSRKKGIWPTTEIGNYHWNGSGGGRRRQTANRLSTTFSPSSHSSIQSWPNGQLLLVVVAGRRRRSEPYHMCVMHE